MRDQALGLELEETRLGSWFSLSCSTFRARCVSVRSECREDEEERQRANHGACSRASPRSSLLPSFPNRDLDRGKGGFLKVLENSLVERHNDRAAWVPGNT